MALNLCGERLHPFVVIICTSTVAAGIDIPYVLREIAVSIPRYGLEFTGNA